MLTDAARVGSVVSAAVKGHRTLGRPEASSLLAVGAALLVLALTAVFLPRLIAYPLGAVLGVTAALLLIRAARLYLGRARAGADQAPVDPVERDPGARPGRPR
jgi:hypothetical protein